MAIEQWGVAVLAREHEPGSVGPPAEVQEGRAQIGTDRDVGQRAVELGDRGREARQPLVEGEAFALTDLDDARSERLGPLRDLRGRTALAELRDKGRQGRDLARPVDVRSPVREGQPRIPAESFLEVSRELGWMFIVALGTEGDWGE